MSNLVITIARQYGSGGRTVGRMLAKRLNIPCYGREIIELAAEDSGINPVLFTDEKKHRGLRALLSGGFKGSQPLSPESAGFTKDDNLFRYQAKIIRQLAQEGSCVIIGRCADHVLSDLPGIVRVFVHATPAFCLQEAMKVNSLPQNEVEKLIAQTDDYRARYYKYYTGQEWKDAQNYDLSLDSSRLGFEGTVEAILAYLEVRKKFDPQLQITKE
ncbi:MAG: cytidylate kinase-like family protein [Eubacteriales bacterium]|nr:cytidylate kinase-like family protein [Eubacteriales bacterium]